MVLIDTTIWSLALRRAKRKLSTTEQRLVAAWVELVKTGAATLIGPIRQEILSGVRHQRDFDKLRRRLSAFRHVEILPIDYDQAASYYNACRVGGVVGTAIDLLICAVAARCDTSIFTTDGDFQCLARFAPIKLYALPSSASG